MINMDIGSTYGDEIHRYIDLTLYTIFVPIIWYFCFRFSSDGILDRCQVSGVKKVSGVSKKKRKNKN
jgi:hypothetical protein